MAKTLPAVNLVAAVAYQADRNTRDDLSNGFIKDEPDYVSNLTKDIRDYWKSLNFPSFCHSQALMRRQENSFGCDALIIIRYTDKAKVCLFEAKYPRLNSPNRDDWDYIQDSSKPSHFSDQLYRQSIWSQNAAIFELFIFEDGVGSRPPNLPQLDQWGSTCIWHEEAYLYDRANRPVKKKWEKADLLGLLKFSKCKPKNLREILQEACQIRGKKGKYLPVYDNQVRLQSEDNQEYILVPASLQSLEDRLPEFCERNRISNFLFLELND